MLRDGERIEQFERGGEVDLLVSSDELARLGEILSALGFARLPGWGYGPHRFFLAYDDRADVWLKLDVVDSIAFGRPIPTIRTELGLRCLGNRQRPGPVYVPAPEDELVALLLHCAFDKRNVSESRAVRLGELCREIRNGDIVSGVFADLGVETPPWEELQRLIRAEEWSTLLRRLSALESQLVGRDWMGTSLRWIANRLARKIGRRIRAVTSRGVTMALLAPDGAGKSTLAKGIEAGFAFPVRNIYMGLYQKTPGGACGGFGTGFVGRIARQWFRYLRGLRHSLRGEFVIFDRYSYDALLPPPRKLSRGKRFRRAILARSCPPPDLVCVLDAPPEVLLSRKGEHDLEFLGDQRDGYAKLGSELPNGVLIDASRPSDEVRRHVTRLLWERWKRRRGEVEPLAQ